MKDPSLGSAHLFLVEDTDGNLVDVIPFCSDGCHLAYCNANGEIYGGWNGCHEVTLPYKCGNCGEIEPEKEEE
jgi:hypothetical protein